MDPKQPRQPYYNYYSNNRPVGPPNRAPKQPVKSHYFRKWPVIILVLIVAGLLINHFIPRSKNDVSHVIAKVTTHKTTPKSAPSDLIPASQLSSMGSAITSVINQNSNIDMSVSLIDLNTNQSEHYGDTQAFTAASTTKVITAADFLNEVQNGQQTLTETINGNSAEYEIQQMIVISDDNAWEALNNALGYPQLQSYANSIGLSSFQSVPNTVTSDDMAHIMAKLYDNQLLNSTNTQLLLSYLKEANYREYIVPAIPAGDTIYHKIGLYGDFVNDEAIVTNGAGKAFVIVIFTNGNGAYDWPARATLMQQITKDALATYF
jgi:beta-lactamase class A